MTKKHFKALAEELYRVRPSGSHWENTDALLQWQMDCLAIADTCQKFNASFDRRRFLDACEGK